MDGRKSFRSLIAENLESRLLLTAVTSVSPAENVFNAPTASNVSATFDEAINPATATGATFVVAGQQSGPRSSANATISTDGQTITLDPAANFTPGEVVKVTATSGIQSSGGSANVPYAWEFRTQVNSGSGQFVDSGQALGANQDGNVRFGDLDGDGDLDVVQGGTFVFFNDGNGTFTESAQRLGGVDWDLADIDGDGDLDVIGENNVFTNDGSGTFTATGQDLSPGAANALEAGDIDGDGDVDVMVGIAYSGQLVWVNDGNGNFSNTGQNLGNASAFDVGFGDFDGDGDLDAFVANLGPANQVFLNDGSGVFTDSAQALGGFRPSQGVELGDVDADGDIDALVSNSGPENFTSVWLNDGSGVFTETGQRLNPGTTGWSSRLGDLDADGDLDAYVPGWANDSEIWLNDGNGLFAQGQSLNFSGLRRAGWADFGDIDGDGDLDIFEGNRFSAGARVWINQNLEPSVLLSVDQSSIAEAGGVATVTASLSEAHTLPVTIELAASGSATASDDYTISGTQIVIAAGDTTGTVTVTAVQDGIDEPDETVDVAITSVTNAQAGGAQQVTITIEDDDEPAPDVTLSVDNVTIAEAAGAATFTATLSATTDLPVTIDLSISGTATATDDYTASGSQIVIAAGDTSGSVVVTAVQDSIDEVDETVIVEIASVTNGLESGDQQATTSIVDDDEPVMPDVTLSVDNLSIDEGGGVANFTATLSETTTATVTVELAISGSATSGADYTVSSTQIVIAAGASSGSITVTAVDDEDDEVNETVVVDIDSVAGGNEVGDQQQTTTITDDDAAPGFSVASLTANESGFVVELSTDLDPSELNQYDTQNLGLGAADVALVGASSGPVAGSVIIDASLRTVTFVKSGDPLVPDTYTVTLRSGTDGFKDAGGQLLDGDGDGTPGDDYSGAFDVAEPAANAITIGLPDFTRGPGQKVNLPANTTAGIPITISNGDNVRAIDLRIAYDPAQLEITGATVGADMPAGATVIVNTNTPGLAILVFFSSTALSPGSGTVINLQASIPTANAGDVLGTQGVLDLHAATISDGNDNESPVIVDDGVHLASYFADVSGNGRVNAADASQVARFAALIDSGFSGALLTDPIIVGDVSGNGRINAADASLVAQFAALIDVPVIPPIPSGVLQAASSMAVPTLDPTSNIGAGTAGVSEGRIVAADAEATFHVPAVYVASEQSAAQVDVRLIDTLFAEDETFISTLDEALADLTE